MSPLALLLSLCLATATTPPTPAAIDARVEELLGRMTLAEKIGQLTQIVDVDPTGPGAAGSTAAAEAAIRKGEVGSMLNATGAARTNHYQKVAIEQSRLHIPLLFGYDVIHGYATIFPVPLGQAAAFDPALVERAERVAAAEASAAGLRWTFAPMVDIARDPRWGRVMEGAGEDPYLGAALAAARVRGFQGADLAAPDSVIACAKHFAAYGAAEAGRDYNVVDISERALREVYLPPFRAAAAAGAGTFMTAFHEIAGVPSTASRFLLTDILRGEWGFPGFVVSDWGAIDELRAHGVAATRAEAARLAINAGVDMDMFSRIYSEALPGLVKSGAVPLAAIDEAARRILRVKLRAGLFERPLTDEGRAARELLSAPHRALAREVAQRSIVLLKNQRELLPLGPGARTIAVLGPFADDRDEPLGFWAARGDARQVVTLLEGLRARAPKGTRLLHAAGTDPAGKDGSGIAAAAALARRADVVLLAVGEPAGMSGEARSRATIDLPGVQKQLVDAVVATGKPVVLVIATGRPLTIASEAARASAVLLAWHLGSESGHALADVLFGDVAPSGKLPITFPATLGQVPIYYAHKTTGRPWAPGKPWTSRYLDVANAPAFPFGFGLGYTRFAYADLAVSPARIPPGGEVRVSATITNTGRRAGAEVVQLYLQDVVGSTTRPARELRGFARVELGPGEKRSVNFTLRPADLAVLDGRFAPVVEPGAFRVWVAPSAGDDGLEGGFDVTAN
jgi:beta-glucosidase